MTVTIKILGPGCRTCITLERVTRRAVADLGLDATVDTVEDYSSITGYGVMSTPALVIDDHVVLAGRVPTPTTLRGRLSAASDRHDRPQTTTEMDHS